jgi:FkbM family methyltransferase
MTLQSTPVRIFDRSYQVFGYPGDCGFDALTHAGTYTEFNLEHLRKFIEPGDVCLDIGANVGIMSLAMASLTPDGVVNSFEASEPTYVALCETIRASGFNNIAAFPPFIVGREGERGDFMEDPSQFTSSHFIPGQGRHTCRSIDSLDLKRVDFIKIDVEGAELDVLDGARETLAGCKPIVVMEFNSYALTQYRKIDPHIALDKILKIFPSVFYFKNRTGPIVPLDNRMEFLRSNLDNGLVDDLVCRWEN